MQGTPTDFWGKLERRGDDVVAWHPLVDHCLDVACCVEALLQHTTLGARFAHLQRRSELAPAQIARLAVLAALHDLGKFTHGFQAKAWPSLQAQWGGHVGPAAALVQSTEREAGAMQLALGLEALVDWCSADDQGAANLLLASISHHGQPAEAGGFSLRPWQARDGRDPVAGGAALLARCREAFPAAFVAEAAPLVAGPAMQHAFSGLVMLADWLGSSVDLGFRFRQLGDGDRAAFARAVAARAVHDIGASLARWRPGAGQSGDAAFDRILPGVAPRAAQRAVGAARLARGPTIALLEAETGAGKTEAAFWHWLRLHERGEVDGLYFALPTRTAAQEIHKRLTQMVAAAFAGPERPAVVLAVPGYLRVDDAEGRRLGPFEVLWPDDGRLSGQARAWAAEHPKRYLAGPIVVGTIDQVLLSTLPVHHAELRATALARQLLVVDEVHASDAYMTRLLEHALAHHVALGGHALLMSATLGAAMGERLRAPRCIRPVPPLAEAIGAPYPRWRWEAPPGAVGGSSEAAIAREGEGKRVEVSLVPQAEDAVAVAARAADLVRQGAAVLVVRNTVRDCLQTQAALEATLGADHPALLRVGGVPVPHHSRYAVEDRRRLDEAIVTLLGKGRARGAAVAVATQTVQQSLDLDADVLLSDLCPADVLLQRIGRLHRHRRARPEGFAQARCLVLVPGGGDLGSWLGADGKGRGPCGCGSVYEDMRMLEATRREVVARGQWWIPEDNRALVEQTTHPEALAALVAELGGAWERHAQVCGGGGAARRGQAEVQAIVRKGFEELTHIAFPPRESAERIATRLGADDRVLTLATPIRSPLGSDVRALQVPGWLVRGLPVVEATEVVATPLTGGFAVSYGSVELRYDRFGLQPRDAAATPVWEEVHD